MKTSATERVKRRLGIFRIRCVQCEVRKTTKDKPQVAGLFEIVGMRESLAASGLDPVVYHQLLQWYGDLSPKAIRYTMASLRALVHPDRRWEITRVSELAAAAVHDQWSLGIDVEAFASVTSETFNGEDRIRVEYIYPIDSSTNHARDANQAKLNGSPLGPRATADVITQIDLETAPEAIESANARERMGADGELEEDHSDVVMVQLPIAMVSQLGKRAALRSNRQMRRMAECIARQVSKP